MTDPFAAFARTILELGVDRITAGVGVTLDDDTIARIQTLGIGPTFAVVTPFNPLGKSLPDTENEQRLAQFQRHLVQDGAPAVPADGWSPDRSHVERGMACGCTLKQGLALGRLWEQLAIFWFDGAVFRVVSV